MVENKRALRTSGAGMVLVWAVARGLPAGETLAQEYDELFTTSVETRVLRGVLERMSPGRSEAVLLPILRRMLSRPWNAHIVLGEMISLALVSRYEGRVLTASSLPKVSGPTRLFPWLAELWSEEQPHKPTAEELAPERRSVLVDLLRAGSPPLELFPWHEAKLFWLLRDSAAKPGRGVADVRRVGAG